MKQTICFSALQSLPLAQQLNMVERLQQQNAKCDSLANDKKIKSDRKNKPKEELKNLIKS
jgi:hypothetical protein